MRLLVILSVILISLMLAATCHRFPDGRVGCVTEDLHLQRSPMTSRGLRNCTGKGRCDDPVYRNEHGSSNTPVLIRTAVHVMNSATGTAPDGVHQAQVTVLMNRMNRSFGAYGVKFSSEVYFHNDDEFHCIPPYSGRDQSWTKAIESMKEKYAVGVGHTLNIFVSCQDASLEGTLFGIGTFPWDNAATNATGGLWLNGIAVNTSAQMEKDTTIEHEMGHCLGLWHTFHGSSEIPGCRFGCEELPHSTTDYNANFVGDFCADTPATPRNYLCMDAPGDACNGAPWGTTDYSNYMGYSMEPEPCSTHFTPDQGRRMKCWICDALQPFTVSGC